MKNARAVLLPAVVCMGCVFLSAALAAAGEPTKPNDQAGKETGPVLAGPTPKNSYERVKVAVRRARDQFAETTRNYEKLQAAEQKKTEADAKLKAAWKKQDAAMRARDKEAYARAREGSLGARDEYDAAFKAWQKEQPTPDAQSDLTEQLEKAKDALSREYDQLSPVQKKDVADEFEKLQESVRKTGLGLALPGPAVPLNEKLESPPVSAVAKEPPAAPVKPVTPKPEARAPVRENAERRQLVMDQIEGLKDRLKVEEDYLASSEKWQKSYPGPESDEIVHSQRKLVDEVKAELAQAEADLD